METYKKQIKDTFNKISSGYDSVNLRFFHTSAIRMIDLLNLKGNESLLDLAAGTGHVTMEAARRLPDGNVHATDLSEKMLGKLKKKVKAGRLNNITFELHDMESRGQSPVYDFATCGFGIFFIADMKHGLQQIKSNLKPGGKLVISTFHESYLYPLNKLFFDRLEKYEIERTFSSWDQINTDEKTQNLLKSAGFREITIFREQHGYFVENAHAWWDLIANTAMIRHFEKLPKKRRKPFIQEHLAEINELSTDKGIWMDVDVIFGMGKA